MKANAHILHMYEDREHNNSGFDFCVSYQGLLCFSLRLDTRLFHSNVWLNAHSLQRLFFFLGSGQKQEVWKEGRTVALSTAEPQSDCWTVMKHFLQVWVSAVRMGVCVCTCNWMLILIFKEAYCNFSLWGFYDTVWQCFLAKLVAATRHVLYYSSELCVHSWLFFVSNGLKRNMSTAPFTGLWFWLISFPLK